MKRQGLISLLAVCSLLAMQGCRNDNLPDGQNPTEWIARSENFEQNYTLDQLLVYAKAEQLRAESTLTYDNPPADIPLKLNGLKENADGLYLLSELEQRLSQAIEAYDNL